MTKQSDPHPYLVQLRKQAKELKQSQNLSQLTEAQFELAKSLGQASWPKLVLSVKQKDLFEAIQQGDKPRFQAILDKTPRLAQMTFEDGSTPILVAAEHDDPDMISALYKAGGSLRDRYASSAHTPLSWALTCWSYHAAVRLLELGEKPDLFCAAGLGSLDLLKQFWPDGKLVSNPSQTGSSRFDDQGNRLERPPSSPQDQVSDALYLACRCGRTEAAEWLLDHGADPNWRGYVGATSLAWAEFANIPELTALLRDKGGDDTIVDQVFLAPPKVFPIMILIGWGFPIWQVKARLEADPSLANARGGHGTVLHVAVYNDRKDVVELLLEAGADKTALNAEGKTPYEQAVLLGKPELAELVR